MPKDSASPTRSQVQASIDELNSILGSDGCWLLLRWFDPIGRILQVELKGRPAGCATSTEALVLLVERRLRHAFPSLRIELL